MVAQKIEENSFKKIKEKRHNALFEWLNDIENTSKELQFWDVDNDYKKQLEIIKVLMQQNTK